MNLDTNALIATLRALANEIARIEHEPGGDDDADNEEIGMYLNDLNTALAGISEIYQLRANANPSLSAAEKLVEYFFREAVEALANKPEGGGGPRMSPSA